MPPLADFVHHFTGLWDRPTMCRIRVYQLDSGMTVAIVTELPDNIVISISNYAAQLATEIRADFVQPGGALAWIEYYPARHSVSEHETSIPEMFARVFFRWDRAHYRDPEWKPFSRSQVEDLIGEPLGD
jgi:hypothetical protein